MPWRKHLGSIILALAIGAGLSYGFWPRPLRVEVAPVTRRPLRVTVEEEGKTRVIDRYLISAPVAGYARRIELDVGDAISQGQVLAWIEPLPSEVLDPRRQAQAEARVAAAGASLQAAEHTAAAAQAEADYAQTEFRCIAALCQRQCLISQDERDRAESRARQTQATQAPQFKT